MKKFNIFTVFFIAMMIAANLITPVTMALTDPVIQADSVLLVDTISGKILYEKNKDRRVAPGGISKVMTLLLSVEAVENGQADPNDYITASKTFLNDIGKEDTTQNLKPGETMSFQDLMFCAFLASADDACNILAEKLAGSIAGFVDRMNEKAATLGCNNTLFKNTGGMAEPGQYTTAWDQYLIFKEAIGHQLFLKIAGTESYKINATEYTAERSFNNSNAMLLSNDRNYYPYSIAGKTGATGENGYSFISHAVKNDLSLISVIFGANSAGGETESSITQSFSETRRLFEWGFSAFKWQEIINKNDIAATNEIKLAKGTDKIDLKPYDTMTILARNDLPAEDIKKEIVIYGQTEGKELTAPIKAGAILGEMKVYVDGALSGKVSLIAAHAIELDRAGFVKTQIANTLSEFWVQFAIFLLLILIGGYAWLIVRDRKARQKKRQEIEETKRKIVEAQHRQKLNK